MIYLIQGFFFEEAPEVGIGYDRGDPRVFVRSSLLRSMFSGLIGPEQDDPQILVGKVIDACGESVLRGIMLTDDTFNFVKLYSHRTDHIDYIFKKIANGTWQGTYEGKATGTGQAHCVLTPITEDFLLPKIEVDDEVLG